MSPAAQALAARLRLMLADTPDYVGKPMFGGICFMRRGNMVLCTTSQGSLLARIGAPAIAALPPQPGIAPMQMGQRLMRDFIEIAPEQLAGDEQLAFWLAAAERFVATMPSK